MPTEIPLRWSIIRRVALFGAVYFTFFTVVGVVTFLRGGDGDDTAWGLVVFFALAASLGWVVERRIADAPSRIFIWSAWRWAAFLGIPAFLTGFVGPLILVPEANQGPLLGILLTGPVGVFLGVIVGVVKALPAYRTARREANGAAA